MKLIVLTIKNKIRHNEKYENSVSVTELAKIHDVHDVCTMMNVHDESIWSEACRFLKYW